MILLFCEIPFCVQGIDTNKILQPKDTKKNFLNYLAIFSGRYASSLLANYFPLLIFHPFPGGCFSLGALMAAAQHMPESLPSSLGRSRAWPKAHGIHRGDSGGEQRGRSDLGSSGAKSALHWGTQPGTIHMLWAQPEVSSSSKGTAGHTDTCLEQRPPSWDAATPAVSLPAAALQCPSAADRARRDPAAFHGRRGCCCPSWAPAQSNRDPQTLLSRWKGYFSIISNATL